MQNNTSNLQRTARSRPVSHHGPPKSAAQQSPSRKVFNCIIDDTALVAGVKKSTRNGVRQWVKNGQIRLFVPLHALEQLSRQKNASTRHGEDVRDTLEWLDHATTTYPHTIRLQGADETYERWEEVERFTVPRSLFSEHDHVEADQEQEGTGLEEDTATKLTLTERGRKASISSMNTASSTSVARSSVRSTPSMSPESPPTSPAKAYTATMTTELSSGASQASGSTAVPVRLRPLFNYILWRIHQELDPVAALETFIFLCNDPIKVHAAKGFDIRCKRLEQLRDAVGREERDVRNRLSVTSKEALLAASPVQKSPPKAPAAMLSPQPTTAVIDPDAFTRTVQPVVAKPAFTKAPQSPRAGFVAPAARGGPVGTLTNNLRGNSMRGRGNITHTGASRVTVAPVRGGLSRGGPVALPNGAQIDPNSFERPRGGFAGGRGAANGARKLWVPT
nr:hypothetical protein B0A51_15389 [Rachicladosporium sp. CCFEE 5018]